MGIKELFEDGTLSVSMLAYGNDCLLSSEGKRLRDKIIKSGDASSYHGKNAHAKLRYYLLSTLHFYDWTIALREHDDPVASSAMWNAVYEKYKMGCRNITVVSKIEDMTSIVDAFRQERRYVGGTIEEAFKNKITPFLDHTEIAAKCPVNAIKKVKITNKEGLCSGFRLFGDNTEPAETLNGHELLLCRETKAFCYIHGNAVPEEELRRIMSSAAGLKN